MSLKAIALLAFTLYAKNVRSTTISEIQGNKFLSPLVGQTVTNVTGIVTAKGTQGFFLLDTTAPPSDTISNGINVFTTSATIRALVNVGDLVSLSGIVEEFRSSSAPADLKSTEIDSPKNITVLSSNHTVTPLIIGEKRSPPTVQYTALDGGNIWSFPNNVSSIDGTDAVLQPHLYGLDFWESLEGQLVTIRNPVALGFNVNSFGDFWVHGDWKVSGKNSRGGLTMTADAHGNVDANPEAIIINSPALDGTPMPSPAASPTGLRMGAKLSDITGVVTYAFDTFRIFPLTAPTVLSAPPYNPPTSPFVPTGGKADRDNCASIVIGDYNVENLAPTSTNLPVVADHIVNFLRVPDIMFLQEIQDNNGPTDDGTVSANVTLSTLVAAIQSASAANRNEVLYSWITIDPIDGTNGGEPGGNIRNAYLYKPDVVQLIDENPGSSTDSAEVVGSGASVTLNLNPVLIDPSNAAFVASRKPLVAHWRVVSTNATLFTINVHQSSKDGSSPIQGDARPPVNAAINARIAQATVEANFVSTILKANPHANIIQAGDFNEFLFTPSVFGPFSGLLTDIDVVINTPKEERYTYVFDMSSQQLDHALISQNLWAGAEWEHVHANTWQQTVDLRGSDHDPSAGRFKLCGEKPKGTKGW